MPGRRTQTARRRTGARLVGLLLALAGPALGQISITSVQSSVFTEGTVFPADVQGITIGTDPEFVPEIVVYLNGTFAVGAQPTVTWTDPLNPNTHVPLSVLNIVANQQDQIVQIQVLVPSGLWTPAPSVPDSSKPRTVQIQVTEGTLTATTQYFLYAPMAAAASPLPLGTAGVSYSTPLLTGGTPPFELNEDGNPVFLGLTVGTGPQGQLLAGTPPAAGVADFTAGFYDFWGNFVSGDYTVQVIAPATVTSVVPNFAPAGSGLMQIAVNGTNFLDPESRTGGSIVRWTINSVPYSLQTTYSSPTLLNAYVPTALMAAPGVAGVGVLQPNGTVYGNVPFALGAPLLTSISPTNVFMGSAAVTMTLNGANFASRVGASDVQVGPYVPQVRVGSNTYQATLVNSGKLTVTIPKDLLNYPGQYSIQVVNPGGSASNLLNFTVNSTLAITTSGLPSATTGTPYALTLTAAGGFPGTY